MNQSSDENIVRDFATGNLVKELDETETDDKVVQNDQFNNFNDNVEEASTDEEDEDEDDDDEEDDGEKEKE